VTRVIVVAAFVAAAALIVVLYFAGTRFAEGATAAAPVAAPSSSTPTPTPAPTATPTPAIGAIPTIAATPGPNDWTALAGGECLVGFTTPWAEEFTVVDCAAEHTAQLVATGVFDGDADAPYPGDAELAARMNLLCTAPTVLDYAVSATVPDIQWQAAYPATGTQWESGDRRWFCYFSRASGGSLGASLATAPVPG
jgi:hypothetical protein